MVNEPRINVKSEFFTGDLQTLYYSMCEQVRAHKGRIYMAGCIIVAAVEYILYGTYPRKNIFDARITDYQNGIPVIETLVIKEFRIQRLKHKDCGHTHALMFEWFIPYQKYSVRFVLLHLHRYLCMETSIEDYCLDHGIPVSTFQRWLDWLKDNMSLLTEAGIVRDRKENRRKLMKWLLDIVDNTDSWLLKSLSGLNLVLFQRHTMPANYMNYKIRQLRDL